jgi:hypothetical protein
MEINDADVAELVDARDLKSLDGNVVRVRVPPPAPSRSKWYRRGDGPALKWGVIAFVAKNQHTALELTVRKDQHEAHTGVDGWMTSAQQLGCAGNSPGSSANEVRTWTGIDSTVFELREQNTA